MKNPNLSMIIGIGLCLLGLVLTVLEKSADEGEFGDFSTYGMIAVIVGLILSVYASYIKKKNQ